MVSLTFVFWVFIVLFGIVGAMRGWAKELLVTFSMILALAFTRLLERYVPFISGMAQDDIMLYWLRTILVGLLVFFGYQTVSLPRLAGKAAREKLEDSLLGFLLGAINGYMVVGTLWFYLHSANYPFEYMTAPQPGTPMGDAAIQLMTAMPPRLLGEPAIYFAVMLCFIFVLIVFI